KNKIEARAPRRQLVAFHGHRTPDAVEKTWPHLGSEDPWIRHAARVALEWQDVKQWQSRALTEKDTLASLTALLALARAATSDAQHPLLERLNALDFTSLPEEQQIIAPRDYELAFIRLGTPEPALAAACTQRLDALYPAKSWRVNHLLCELLAYLKAPAFRDKTVALLTHVTPRED